MFKKQSYKIGDTLKIKQGIVTHFNLKIGGWTGRVIDIHDHGKIIELEWDSEVLISMTDSEHKKLIKLDYQPFYMRIPYDDLEPAEPRDDIERLEVVQDLIEKKTLKLEKKKENKNDFRYYTEKYLRKFIHCQYYPMLTYFQRENLFFIVDCFAEFMFDFYKQMPIDWNISALEDVCLKKIPEKVTTEKDIFKNFGIVLYYFFKFIQERSFFDTTDLQTKIKDIDKNIYNNAINKEKWSNAKKFTMAAIEKGIDLDDTQKVYTFINEYNKNLSKNLKNSHKIELKDIISDYVYSKC